MLAGVDEFRGGHVELLLEVLGEVGRGGVAHEIGDLADPVFPLGQELGRLLKAADPDVFEGAQARVGANLGGQGLAGDHHHRSELGRSHFRLGDMLQDDAVQLLHELALDGADGCAAEPGQRIAVELLVLDLPVLEEVADRGLEDFDLEGLLNVAVHAGLQGAQVRLDADGGRQQDDEDVAVGDIVLDEVAKLAAVHDRHHDVADDHVDVVGLDNVERLLAVGRGHDGVVFQELVADEVA